MLLRRRFNPVYQLRSNFRSDVTVSGTINSSDVTLFTKIPLLVLASPKTRLHEMMMYSILQRKHENNPSCSPRRS